MQSKQQSNNWASDILFLGLILGGLFFILAGARPLFVPDEGRYAEIAREMTASGDYVTPYLNGIKYFEKPALFYWLESAAIHLGGLNLWSIRSVNILLGILGCLLTYCTTRSLYNRRTGLFAAFILGSSSLYFVMLHMISLDLPVTIFLSATLYAFILGIQQPDGTTRRLYLWLASASAAFAVLTKGLIGIVFPIMIISTFIAVMGEWRLLLRLYLPSCILIFLLIALPWHLLVGQRNPEFFYFYFVKQHFLRYTTLKIGHYQPAWFFIPAFIAGFFPWIVFLPQTLIRTISTCRYRSKNNSDLFFLMWAVLIFIFFSLSKSKLIPYILPIFPPLAILTARYLDESLQHHFLRGIKIGFAFLLPASILIAITFFLFLQKFPLPHPDMAALYLYASVAILITGSLLACFYLFRDPQKSILITIASSCLFLLFSFSAMPFIDTRTILPLAQTLKPLLKPTDEVISYNQYYQDLPFYLERRITILNWKNELTQGMDYQDTHEWMIKDRVFSERWHSKQRVFTIMGNQEYQNFLAKYPDQKHYIIGKTLTNILISNQKITK